MSAPRVLVVEDHPELREAVRRFLECAGLAVDAVASTAEAKVLFDRGRHGALLVDLEIEDAVGPQLRFIREASQHPSSPLVVAWSGWVDEHAEALAVEAGAHRFLSKPVPFSEVLEAILGSDAKVAPAGDPSFM